MTEDMAHWLQTAPGQETLARAMELRVGKAETLAALTRLRRVADPDGAAAAWEMADLRARGQIKFGADAAQMSFVREALEQASSRRAAAYHARRFVRAGAGAVADVCGGIGGDALAFARAGLSVTLYEQDSVRALFAAKNARAAALTERIEVVRADVTTVDIAAGAVWFDPARRAERGRVAGPEEYQPPLSTLRRWQAQGIETIGVKLAPAVDHAVAAEYGAELEFLSDGGECKEALLWLGRLRTGDGLRATRLTDEGEWTLPVDPGEAVAVAGPQAGEVLYEPDPAVIRAHGVATLARQLDARLLHPQIAYLIGERYVPTPFASAYDVLERLSYSRRRLQEALTRRGVGQVVIKKRGFPQEPDDVRRELKLRGPHALTVVLTRASEGAGHQVILCRPVAAA